MSRRLFYLLPDKAHARNLAKDLKSLGVASRQIHAVAKDSQDLEGIANIHLLDEVDRLYWMEWFLWRLNLAIFGLALLATISMTVWWPSMWIALPLAVMVVCLADGIYFATRMPNVHLEEFRPALRHGEILVMVDVSPQRLPLVINYIRHKHPAVVIGGVSWSV